MNARLLVALPLLSVFLLPGCGSTMEVAQAPVPVGTTAELAGTWDFTMPRGANGSCTGVMTIDGATGRGTFSNCYAASGTVVGAVSAQHEIVVVFSDGGTAMFWIRGLYTPGTLQLEAPIYGPNWNGQAVLTATHR